MGIAEQNMCSWAAGLAREGYRPFLHTFSVFLSRRILDQVEMSVAYPNLPVTFVGFVPGLSLIHIYVYKRQLKCTETISAFLNTSSIVSTFLINPSPC